MPIEFPCSGCSRPLRVPDAAAGKQSRCPACGTVQAVPGSAEPAYLGGQDRPQPPQPQWAGPGDLTIEPKPPLGGPRNPFADDDWQQANPYASPQIGGEPLVRTPQQVRSMVLGPALGILIAAVLALAYMGLTLIVGAIEGFEEVGFEPPVGGAPGEREGFIIGYVLVMGLMVLLPLVMLAGAVQMLRLRSWWLAMTASVLSIFPCTVCCILSIPFGIWGVVALNSAEVKAAFH